MSQPLARPLAAVDADLRSCRDVRLAAQRELAVVRRRQAELADIEAELVVTIDSRGLQADRLLDERLDAVVESEDRLRAPTSDDRWRLAGV